MSRRAGFLSTLSKIAKESERAHKRATVAAERQRKVEERAIKAHERADVKTQKGIERENIRTAKEEVQNDKERIAKFRVTKIRLHLDNSEQDLYRLPRRIA